MKKSQVEIRLGFLANNYNFDTNAPLFEVRECKVILGGAFLSQGVQIGFRGANSG